MPDRRIKGLKRRPASRQAKRRYEVFCEGKLTEIDYIAALRRKYEANTLVEMIMHPAAGVPLTLADKAIAARRLRRRQARQQASSSYEQYDQIWVVFDRDLHPNYQEAVNKCEQNGIFVARSNPCFELWLVLHKQDYDGLDNHHEMQKRLVGLCPEYDPDKSKTVNCDDMMVSTELAERRAKAQLKRRENEGEPIRPPYTTFFEFTQSLRSAARPKGKKDLAKGSRKS